MFSVVEVEADPPQDGIVVVLSTPGDPTVTLQCPVSDAELGSPLVPFYLLETARSGGLPVSDLDLLLAARQGLQETTQAREALQVTERCLRALLDRPEARVRWLSAEGDPNLPALYRPAPVIAGGRVAGYLLAEGVPAESAASLSLAAALLGPDLARLLASPDDGPLPRPGSTQLAARHDALTDLPDRLTLMSRADEAMRAAQHRGHSVGLLVMDLDRFKEINSTLGHDIGDRTLVEVAQRLRRLFGTERTVVRLGGDEFAVLVPEATMQTLDTLADRIQRALEMPFEVGGHSIMIGVSIGMSLYPEHADQASLLLQRADMAMYVAKRSLLGHTIYSESDDQRKPDLLHLAAELRTALEDDQFVLHYQPKVDMRTGEVESVEALVRWQHPVRGLVPPGDFVPAAEQSGTIRLLSSWVLGKALRDQRYLLDLGLNVPVAVNLSVYNLLDEGLPESISALLEAMNVSADSLQIEVTESAIMSDPALIGRTLWNLRDRGIYVSIDDFGTGYSSLTHLKRLPADAIKIDKSFVVEMRSNEEDAFIARSVIDLGHNLKTKVVAEGVETAETWAALEEMGCDVAQGYYISRPLPLPSLLTWLETRARNRKEARACGPPGADCV